MTNEMKYLIMLCSCGAAGRPCPLPETKIDWNKLVCLAKEQSMTYVAAAALKNSAVGCPDEIVKPLYANLLGVSLKTKLRNVRILSLLGELEQAGVRVVVLKGIDVARLYALPECRPSADTDILIGPADEQQTLSFFEQNGFSVNRRPAEMHHSVCTHPELGMLEIHISLWEEIYDETLFSSVGVGGTVAEMSEKVILPDGGYYSLKSYNRLLFVTLHMLKHFVICGMSLRMMVDTALLYRCASAQDTERFASVLKRLGFDKTVAAIFGLLKEYGCFTENELPFQPADKSACELVGDDLEKGGWQGINDEADRREGWYYLCRERRIEQKGRLGYFVFIFKTLLPDKLHAAFPPTERLESSYPRLKRCRSLYPLCWLHRLFSRGFKALFFGKTKSRVNIENESRLAQAGKERYEMFRSLGLNNK